MSEPTTRAISHALDNHWYVDPNYPNRYKRDGGGHTGTPTAHLNKMLDHDDKCVECGIWIEYGYHGDEARKAKSLCLKCEHYVNHIKDFDIRDAIIEAKNGERWGYHLGTQTGGNPDHRGSGGRRVVVLFNDGRRVETVDLWCWGTGIPEHFWDRMPVNAKFDHAPL